MRKLKSGDVVCICRKNKFGMGVVCDKRIFAGEYSPDTKKVDSYIWENKTEFSRDICRGIVFIFNFIVDEEIAFVQTNKDSYSYFLDRELFYIGKL